MCCQVAPRRKSGATIHWYTVEFSLILGGVQLRIDGAPQSAQGRGRPPDRAQRAQASPFLYFFSVYSALQ